MFDDISLARRTLGKELRRLREIAGLSGRDLARLVGVSQSYVSRVENGTGSISKQRLAEWIRVLDADCEAVEGVEALHARAHGIRTPAQGGPVDEVEEEANLIQVFNPAGVPQLLWTPMYAWWVLKACPHGNSSDHVRFVDELQRRQEPLLNGRKHYEFLIVDGALPAPNTPISRGLLGRILSLDGMARIAIVPADCPLISAISSEFTIYGDQDGEGNSPVVVLPTLHTQLIVTAPRDVASYLAAFEGLAANAVEIQWSMFDL